MPSSNPIASFGYTLEGNEVQFENLSQNIGQDTVYLWDFGDGVTSNEENPIHVYLDNLIYVITFKVTNPTASNTIQVSINLSNSPSPGIMNDIGSMVDLYSPTQVISTIVNHKRKEFLIAKWQQYLQPLVENPEVTPANTFTPSSWPPLVNSLIAKLVIVDIIEMNVSALAISISNEGQIPSTGNYGSNTNTNGTIKSIETGPTKVERYENKDISSYSEKMWNLARAYQQLVRPGGALESLKEGICQESARVRIYLPNCGQLPINNISFQVSKNHKKGGYNTNPWGITERME